MSKESLQLPKTAFSMKANLPKKEPDIINQWEENNLYEKLTNKAKVEKRSFYMTAPLMPTDIFIWELLLTKY